MLKSIFVRLCRRELLIKKVNAIVERKVTLTDAMANIRELLGSDSPIDHSDYSVKIFKLARDAYRLSGLVKSNGLELQTVPGLFYEASR